MRRRDSQAHVTARAGAAAESRLRYSCVAMATKNARKCPLFTAATAAGCCWMRQIPRKCRYEWIEEYTSRKLPVVIFSLALRMQRKYPYSSDFNLSTPMLHVDVKTF